MSALTDHEKADIAQRMVDSIWTAGSLEGVHDIVSEEYIEYVPNPPDQIEGRDQFAEIVEVIHKPTPLWSRKVDTITVKGELVLLRYTEREPPDGDDAASQHDERGGLVILRFREGEIVEGIDIGDSHTLVHQVLKHIEDAEDG